MRSALWSWQSEWELRKAEPPMTLYNGDVHRPLPVLPRLVPAGHGVAAPEPATKKAADPSGSLP